LEFLDQREYIDNFSNESERLEAQRIEDICTQMMFGLLARYPKFWFTPNL